MARWHETRVKLFDEFTSNLSLHEPNNVGYFKCPICLELFSPEYLISRPKENAIIVAHVIPKSFLNAGYTLSCMRCDGKFGSLLASTERVLRHNIRLAKWHKRPYYIRTNFVVETESFDVFAEVNWNDNGEPIPTFRKSDIPKNVSEDILHHSTKSFPSRDIHGNPDDFILWRSYLYDRRARYANLNWWHSLYLFMFHQFGYSWVLNDTRASLIRNQLLNLDQEIIPSVYLEPKVYPLIAPYEHPPHNHLPIRPSLRFGIDADGNLIDSGYFMIFPQLANHMNNITLFLPWDFNKNIQRPEPVQFTERLKYGHSILKHRIPDDISPKDIVNFKAKMNLLAA